MPHAIKSNECSEDEDWHHAYTGQGNVDGLSTFMNELPVGLSGIVEEAQTLDREYLPITAFTLRLWWVALSRTDVESAVSHLGGQTSVAEGGIESK